MNPSYDFFDLEETERAARAHGHRDGLGNGRAADGAAPFPTEPPRPLRRALPPAEAFPVEALGNELAPAARAIHDIVQAPLAVCAQSVLAAASLVVQAHADVELPTGQARPTSLFLITVAASGERKSACDGEALWPVRKREQALRETYEAGIEAHGNDLAAWQKQREQILGDKKAYPDRAAKRAALEALGPGPLPPSAPMLLCSEPTYEGLVKMLASGQPSVGLFSAEGGMFVGGHGLSAENKLRTASGLSGLWDGDVIRRVRAGDGAMVLPGRRLALHLMVQTEVSCQLLADPVLADQGLLSRLLVVAPESAAGSRIWRDPKPESPAEIRRYGARLLNLLEAPLPLAEGKVNELAPRRLPLSAAARTLWIKFSDSVETQLGPDGALAPIRGLANKLPEHAARIAAVLTLVGDLQADEVTGEAMAAGIVLAQHYAAEALRLFQVGATDPELLDAERLLKWLHTGWGEPCVSLPDIYQRGPNMIRDSKKAKRLVDILCGHGWLAPIKGGAEIGGVRRRDAWRIVREEGQ